MYWVHDLPLTKLAKAFAQVATSDDNMEIPQSIDVYLEQLTNEDPRLRFEAIHHFALSVFLDRFNEVHEAVWKLTEDPHERVRWSAGIAASMITARHMPLKYSWYIGISNGYVPDFLGEWVKSDD